MTLTSSIRNSSNTASSFTTRITMTMTSSIMNISNTVSSFTTRITMTMTSSFTTRITMVNGDALYMLSMRSNTASSCIPQYINMAKIRSYLEKICDQKICIFTTEETTLKKNTFFLKSLHNTIWLNIFCSSGGGPITIFPSFYKYFVLRLQQTIFSFRPVPTVGQTTRCTEVTPTIFK